MKRVSLLILFLLFLSLSPTLAQTREMQEITIADFETRSDGQTIQNNLGEIFRVFSSSSGITAVSLNDENAYEGEASLQVSYRARRAGHTGTYTHLGTGGSPIDAREYNAVSFYVRGDRGGERLEVGLADLYWVDRQDVMKSGLLNMYLPEGEVTKEWQRVIIPFGLFSDGINTLDFSELRLISFIPFQGEGTFYIDDIQLIHMNDAFASRQFEEEVVNLCNFENGTLRTEMGGWVGPFMWGHSKCEIEINAETNHSGNGALQIDYEKKEYGWCGIYFKFYIPDEHYLDLRQYRAISFWIKGETGEETFDVRLADRRHTEREDSLSAGFVGEYLPLDLGDGLIYYQTTVPREWTRVVVPLANFGPLDFCQISELVFNFHTNGVGTIYVDDIELSQVVPETEIPRRANDQAWPSPVLQNVLRNDAVLSFGMSDANTDGSVSHLQSNLSTIYPHLADRLAAESGFYGAETRYAAKKFIIEFLAIPSSIPLALIAHHDKLALIVRSNLLGEEIDGETLQKMEEVVRVVEMPPSPDKVIAWFLCRQRAGLIPSYRIPLESLEEIEDEVALLGRAWSYDEALAAIALTMHQTDESTAAAEEIFKIFSQNILMSALDAGPKNENGLPFWISADPSYYWENIYTRTGTVAWMGYAAVFARERGLDDHGLAERLADYVMNQQILDQNDPRYGGVTGGSNWEGYWTPVTFCSTEHNIDAYFFLRDLAELTGNREYLRRASLIKTFLLGTLWEGSRFLQGVYLDETGAFIRDEDWALDCQTWGSLFLISCAQGAKAQGDLLRADRFFQMAEVSMKAAEHFATESEIFPSAFTLGSTQESRILHGFSPYGENPIIWSEGTVGYILAAYRLGRADLGDFYSDQVFRMTETVPDGATLYVTRSVLRENYEFKAWPSLVGSAWYYFSSSPERRAQLWTPEGTGRTPYVPIEIEVLSLPCEEGSWSRSAQERRFTTNQP